MTSEEEKHENEKSTKNLILGENHVQNDFFDKTKYTTKSNVIGGNKSKLNTKTTYLKKPCYCSVNNEIGTEHNTKSIILKRPNIPDNFIDKGIFNSKSIILKKTCQSKSGSTPILKTSELITGNINNNQKEKRNFMIKESEKPNIHIPNFQEKVMKHIKKLTSSIECTIEQKKIILSKSEEILKKYISRAERGEIKIPSNANLLTNAAAIIYAVLISNENMPKISGRKLSEIVGVSKNMVYNLYNTWYKNLVRKLDFDFMRAQLGRSREILSLYLFELLMFSEIDLDGLISHIEKIDISKIVLRLKEIFIDAEIQLTQTEGWLLKQLTEKEIKAYQDMGTNYSDVFDKYFTDLINIVKLLIISNKSHKIIGADFSAKHFVRFLVRKGINLFLTDRGFYMVLNDIFNFLHKSKYANLFPNRFGYGRGRGIHGHEKIIGGKIKYYVMQHLYKGRYYDKKDGFAKCPECLREGFTVNTSIPGIKSKEFHHKNVIIQRYRAIELYALFTRNRGNSNFLPDLIKKMEKEEVVLLCGSHHRIIQSVHFTNFKKLISWENIPSEFPYQDIFDLPPEVIHILISISLENSHYSRTKSREEKDEINRRLIYNLRKKYIIDRIYGGICPACGEFNTYDHLTSFEFNHLYELMKMTPEEREKYKKIKKNDRDFIESLPCSEAVKQLEKQVGGYVCRNCHFTIHKDKSDVNEIYEDPQIISKSLKYIEDTVKKYKQNLIQSNESIMDPLKLEIKKYKTFRNYLFALFEISKRKKEENEDAGATRREMLNYLGYTNYKNAFEKRKVSEQYVRIVKDGKNREISYYIKPEGERIVRLMYYFRDYYKNYKK